MALSVEINALESNVPFEAICDDHVSHAFIALTVVASTLYLLLLYRQYHLHPLPSRALGHPILYHPDISWAHLPAPSQPPSSRSGVVNLRFACATQEPALPFAGLWLYATATDSILALTSTANPPLCPCLFSISQLVSADPCLTFALRPFIGSFKHQVPLDPSLFALNAP